MPAGKRAAKRSASHVSNAVLPLSSDDGHSFKPEQFTDITVHYLSHSYHMHTYVLVTMSKLFEAALVTDADSCSVCASLEDSHRCITLEGNEIGGVAVSAEELLYFFEHVYSMTDHSGEWKKLIEKKRTPSDSSTLPDSYGTGT